jgi:hypothetical protein
MAETELTIDEEIAADWKAIQAKHAAPEETAAEVATTPEAEEPPPETEKVTDTKPRDETGKFVKAAETPKPAETAAPTELAKEPEQTQEPVTRDVKRPPSSWKPLAKSMWDKAPPEIQAEVHRREADWLAGQAKLLPDAQLGKTMRSVIQPYQAIIDAEGGTPERAVADLLRTAAMFRMGTPAQKQQALMAIAQQYNVDLSQLNGGQQSTQDGQQQQAGYRDDRVDKLLADMQREQLTRQQSERQSIEKVAADWIAELDATGKPLRPYVDDVMTEMNALLPQIRAADPSKSHKDVLQEAYERATWAHPEIRTIFQKEQIEQLEAKRRTENQERVNLARKATSVNVPRRGSIPTPAAPGSMDDTIRETARTLGLITN